MITPEHFGGLRDGLRPDLLRMELSVSLSSDRQGESDDFGWECWSARIFAGWDTYEDPQRGAEIASRLNRISFTSAADADSEDLEIAVGGCELMLLRFDVPHPVFGDDVLVPSRGESIYDAADALSQDLADLVGPLVKIQGDDPFVEQVMEASELAWYDELLIIRSVALTEQFRGMGIGGWAAARAIAQLAPAETTLVALKAAPLNRADFLRGLGADPDSRDELTAEQSAAWEAACTRIAASWRRHLGVQQLDGHPGVLFGPGGVKDAIAATLARWR